MGSMFETNMVVVITTIACAGSLLFFMLISGALLLWRYLSYRETMALAERGLARPPRASDGKNVLRWGIILAALGFALGIGLYPIGASTRGLYPLGLGPWMLFALLPFFFGLALILIHVVTVDKRES
jgi:hypothetical protein